jgi:hypothetical protein
MFVVWRGHRDYEENVVVCVDREDAEQVLRENGVEPRRVPGYIENAPKELLDADLVPWGIQEVPLRSGYSVR